jgi:hypothetical protein
MAELPSNIREEDILYHWQSVKGRMHQRTSVWYVVATLIGLGFIAYAIWTANFLFAVMVLLVTFIIIIQQANPNRVVDVYVLYQGILIGNDFYAWKRFKSFYILYEPDVLQKVYFEFKNPRPDIYVEFGEEDPLEIRDVLLQILKENLDKDDESLSDVMQRLLKL